MGRSPISQRWTRSCAFTQFPAPSRMDLFTFQDKRDGLQHICMNSVTFLRVSTTTRQIRHRKHWIGQNKETLDIQGESLTLLLANPSHSAAIGLTAVDGDLEIELRRRPFAAGTIQGVILL